MAAALERSSLDRQQSHLEREEQATVEGQRGSCRPRAESAKIAVSETYGTSDGYRLAAADRRPGSDGMLPCLEPGVLATVEGLRGCY